MISRAMLPFRTTARRAEATLSSIAAAATRQTLPQSALLRATARTAALQQQGFQSGNARYNKALKSKLKDQQNIANDPFRPPEPKLKKPLAFTEGESEVWDIIIRELKPRALVVKDISGGCGSMYAVDVSTERFRGLTTLEQQRMVNAALGDLVKEWHGLQVRTRIPE